MLIQSGQLKQANIISLHTSHIIGELNDPIINPHNLEIVAFYCSLPQPRPEPMVLITRDIRQGMAKRVFINSIDEITPASELIRYKEIMDLGFQLIDKPVRTVSKHRLGKVEEYVIDSLNWQVQKLHIKQALWRNLSSSSLIIDRRQIVEVSDREITVSDASVTKAAVAPSRAT